METDKTRPSTLHDQIRALGLQIDGLRQALTTQRPSGASSLALETLSHLSAEMERLGQRLRSFEEEHANLRALANIGQVVNSSLELDEVLRIVMDTIVRLTGAERGFLMLRNERGEMATYIARNWEQESIKPNEAATSRTVVQRVLESGQPLLTTNAQEDQRFLGQESIVALNLRSILCVPLKVKNELIGVLYADNRARSGIFDEAERDLLVAFANQAAVAIDNARLFSSLKRTLEEVTALKNLMDNVFASITSGVLTTDDGDTITLANRAAEAILGRGAAEIVGRSLDEVLAPLTRLLSPHLREVRQKDRAVLGLEISHSLPERGVVDWRLNLSPLKDAAHKTQGVAIVLDDMTERKRLEAQRKLLERMVSPVVLDQIDEDSFQMGGKKVDITILFADIRGFTTYSEKRTPEDLVAILNRYLAAAAEAVLSYEGTVDKFLGDAVMAWYNAPLPQPDHTLRAVKTAVAIREAIRRLHRELPAESRLDFGVGIHYGEAVLGWIGTEKRLEYTAIGDSVNTTKRIQENSARGQILISRQAYERVQTRVEARPYAPLIVKGKAQPLEVYEVVGLRD